MHQSGEKHVTGEAMYSSDIQVADMLHMAFVVSPVAAGTIDYVDITEALELPGVVAYIDHNDIPGNKRIAHGQTLLLAVDEVEYHCHPIGAIIAKDHETARRGANLVKVNITPKTAIVTIDVSLDFSNLILKVSILASN